MKILLLSLLSICCIFSSHAQDNKKSEKIIFKELSTLINHKDFMTDNLSTVVNFKIETSENGTITKREILEPIIHSEHAQYIESILNKITVLPKSGSSSFSSSINLWDYIPKNLRADIIQADSFTPPKYKGSEDINLWFIDMMNIRTRKMLLKRGQVTCKLIHDPNNGLQSASMHNTILEFKELPEQTKQLTNKNWTPAIINGKAQVYTKIHVIDIASTLTEEEISDPETNIVTVMPKFNGSDNYTMFRNLITKRLQELGVIHFGNQWATEYTGKTIISFIVEKDGTTTIESIKNEEKQLSHNAISIINTIISETRWTPGTRNGKVARIKLIFPITIK